jgi:hypothetical protein
MQRTEYSSVLPDESRKRKGKNGEGKKKEPLMGLEPRAQWSLNTALTLPLRELILPWQSRLQYGLILPSY